MDRGSSELECQTRNRESPGSNHLCYRFEVWAVTKILDGVCISHDCRFEFVLNLGLIYVQAFPLFHPLCPACSFTDVDTYSLCPICLSSTLGKFPGPGMHCFCIIVAFGIPDDELNRSRFTVGPCCLTFMSNLICFMSVPLLLSA